MREQAERDTYGPHQGSGDGQLWKIANDADRAHGRAGQETR